MNAVGLSVNKSYVLVIMFLISLCEYVSERNKNQISYFITKKLENTSFAVESRICVERLKNNLNPNPDTLSL